jgi:DNA-binding MarR family transcriptional regulator
VSRTTEREPAAPDLMDGLVQTSFAVMALLSQVAAAHDLSLTQLRALAILRDREPKMAELAAHLGLEKSSVSGLVDRAVKRGLVRRDTSSDDARAVRLSLAPEGQRLAVRLTDQIADLLAPITGRLSPAQQRHLASLLTTLLD